LRKEEEERERKDVVVGTVGRSTRERDEEGIPRRNLTHG